MRVTESITIRGCGDSDAAPLSALAARLFTQAYGATHPEPALGRYLAESFAVPRIRAELMDPRASLLVAESGDRTLLAYAHLRESDAGGPAGVEGSRPVEIVRFYVDSAWHGTGVARSLMIACDREAARRGADSLWLSVWQEAARPIAFYRRTGFRVVGTSTFRFGDRTDHDFVMARGMSPG